MILHVTLPVALAQPGAPVRPSVRLAAQPRVLTLRRELESSGSGRRWLLEVEVDVPAIDPERLLTECEDFLVDGSDGRQIGVVDGVERSGPASSASALLVAAGWFGRRRFRVDTRAIEALLPAERRVIVDESGLHPLPGDRRA